MLIFLIFLIQCFNFLDAYLIFYDATPRERELRERERETAFSKEVTTHKQKKCGREQTYTVPLHTHTLTHARARMSKDGFGDSLPP